MSEGSLQRTSVPGRTVLLIIILQRHWFGMLSTIRGLHGIDLSMTFPGCYEMFLYFI